MGTDGSQISIASWEGDKEGLQQTFHHGITSIRPILQKDNKLVFAKNNSYSFVVFQGQFTPEVPQLERSLASVRIHLPDCG